VKTLVRFAVVAALAALPILASSGAAKASPELPPPGTTCTWGGTPVTPTGRFTISPGLTDNPLAAPARFWVTGELAGDPGCRGTLTYVGQIDAGGTCAENTFDGAAHGMPGVRSFAGVGIGPLGPALLYDVEGNVVASENANVNTPNNIPHFLDCNTPTGFAGGDFSSIIVFVK
jgi:hypothetical protein